MCAPARTKDQDVRWVYTRAGMPVEITAEFENWRRIRDWEGAEGWVYHSLLSGKRTAVVVPNLKDELVPLYESAGHQIRGGRARCNAGVLGALKSCTGSWCEFARQGFRRLDPPGPAVGRLSEREGRLAYSVIVVDGPRARARSRHLRMTDARILRVCS